MSPLAERSRRRPSGLHGRRLLGADLWRRCGGQAAASLPLGGAGHSGLVGHRRAHLVTAGRGTHDRISIAVLPADLDTITAERIADRASARLPLANHTPRRCWTSGRNLPPTRGSSVRSRLYLGVAAHSLTSGDRLVPMGPEANESTSRLVTSSVLDRIREYLDELRRRAVRPGPTANPRTSTTNSSRSNHER